MLEGCQNGNHEPRDRRPARTRRRRRANSSPTPPAVAVGSSPRPFTPTTGWLRPAAANGFPLSGVLVAAGAAATTAVLGLYFGPAGTVAGAALGSVASTLAASALHQRSSTTEWRRGVATSTRAASAPARVFRPHAELVRMRLRAGPDPRHLVLVPPHDL